VSVLCIAGGGSILPLDPCRQRLSEDGAFRYLGGSVPLGEAELSERACALAVTAVGSFRDPGGFIGVDLLLGETGKDDQVIEINPRPTTSYCALRRRSPVNLAQLSLDLLAGGKPANPNWPPHQESYNSEGRVKETMKPASRMETAS
jgi:predicted ATP-grasp superfamily ATP-dependent carboligase